MEGLWALTKGLMTPSLDQCVGTPGFPIRALLTPRSDQSLKNKELALHQDLTPPPPFLVQVPAVPASRCVGI